MLQSIFIFISIIFFYSPSLLATPNYNQIMLEVLREMPSDGGYDTSPSTLKKLEGALTFNNDQQKESLRIHMENASPSFCSGATYLVMIKLLTRLQNEKQIQLSSEVLKELLIHGQGDGVGIWGRWNANGPGTARLFFELGLGRNFSMNKIAEAQPGDFLKIFWTEEIGAQERGHSVVFTGLRKEGEQQLLCFWSSNKPTNKKTSGGMGEKCVDLKTIRHAIFSRLEKPERFIHAPRLLGMNSSSYTDEYLKSMLVKKTTFDEVCRKVGCQ